MEWLLHKLRQHDPLRVCIVYKRQLTYGQMIDRISEYKTNLLQRGITERSVVALCLPNSFTFIYLFLALADIGAKVMLIDPRIQGPERTKRFEKLEPNWLIESREMLILHNFYEEVPYNISALNRAELLLNDEALLQFSSATTGEAKLIGRSSRSVEREIVATLAVPHGIESGDKVLVLPSLSHTYGLITGLLQSLYAGATAVFSSIKTAQIVEQIVEVGVTIIYGVPFHYDLILLSKKAQLRSVRAAVSAGERLPDKTHSSFYQRFGISIGQQYGMTEAGIITVDFLGQNFPDVGQPVHTDSIKEIEGAIYVRLSESPYMLASRTEAGKMKDGWLETSDLGHYDKDTQLLHLFGRKDSVYIAGGIKINLYEVEDILNTCPDLADSIVQVENNMIVAYIQVLPSFNHMVFVDWCKQNIAAYRTPALFRVMKDMPRTPGGKKMRSGLSKHCIESFSLNQTKCLIEQGARECGDKPKH
ncbi:class I adenylate-forming enzyme family protein [Paenibacillus xylaniclasticus]|uniref:class I adenylate-forming enzyme family protein n=1 Tax=Paenibacillus xylaniclasticus TaxID=588083 RepID=UPI0013E01AB0|nr:MULTISPECIES: class I adenylate-forming enzyme family protein [Paenibacillus]GFN32227.1 fatty acid--CoA ligase [Paenibacillus curdlanolyticus]